MMSKSSLILIFFNINFNRYKEFKILFEDDNEEKF